LKKIELCRGTGGGELKDTEIIEALLSKLRIAAGRHLYGVVGSYDALERFAPRLCEVTMPDGSPFPEPVSVTAGVLSVIPQDEFTRLAAEEARYPEAVRARVNRAFEEFLRSTLKQGMVVMKDLEILFAYDVDLSSLRALSTDRQRALLLLPGKRTGEKITMFPGSGDIFLPVDLIANDHIWTLQEQG